MTTDARVRITAQNDTAAAFREIARSGSELGDKLHGIFVTAFAGISVAGIWEGVRGAIDYGDAIAKAAEKSGMATAAFSQLAYAAKQNNVDIDALSKGVKSMQVAIDKASSAFDTIGININKLRQLRPDQQFEAIAEAISKIGDPAARAHAAIEIFGRAGADLLPILDKGAAGIERLRTEADQLGLTLDEKGAKSMEDAEKAIKQMDAAFQGLWQTLALKLAPILEDTFQYWREFISPTGLEQLQDKLRGLLAVRDAAMQPNEQGLTLFMGTPEKWQQLNDQIAMVRAQIAALNAEAAKPKVNAAAGIVGDPNAVAKGWELLKDVTAEKREHLKLTLLQIDANVREIESDAAASKKQLDYALQFDEATKKGALARLKGTIDANQTMLDEMRLSYDKLLGIARQASQGMETAFESFFYDPMKEGLKGLLGSFIDTVRRMMAQAAAAKLMQSLFGSDAGAGLFTTILGAIFGSVTGAPAGAAAGGGHFSGPRAGGGPVMGGMAYLVGEQGRELFIPRGSGTIVPNSKLGGGDSVTINHVTNVDARGAQEGQAGQIQRALDAHSAAIRQDIIEGIRRRKYRI